MLGEAGVCRLWGMPTDGRLGVAEGVETALAAYKKFGIITWAAMTAFGVEKFEIPPGCNVDSLWIFGDNDHHYKGQSAAYSLAHRIQRTGIRVQVMIPEEIGTDWADS
jgi:putative DNA primase/helicase